tara:strand:+ start:218 stop:868 length:651 start_codon:yes stop_codon:yes gene_type:complete
MENNILLNQLKNFYQIDKNINTLFRILNHNNIHKNNKENKISLRLIDWFVTNYCKKNKIIIEKKEKNKTNHINIYNSYKSNLKAFSKQLFDPFRRKNELFLNYTSTSKVTFTEDKFLYKNNHIKTTIGQLNFFKWIIDNDIYEYIKSHKKVIENDMIISQKENNKKKMNKHNLVVKTVKNKNGIIEQVSRKKRIELSKSVNKNIQFNKQHTILYFD